MRSIILVSFLAFSTLFAPPVAEAAAGSTTSLEQPAASPLVTPQLSSDQFVQAALGARASLDAGRGAEIYDNGSKVLKGATDRATFLKNYADRRAETGVIANLQWVGIDRVHLDAASAGAPGAPSLPAGDYLSVKLIGMSKPNKLVIEQISFRFDEDKVWRIAGYAISIK